MKRFPFGRLTGLLVFSACLSMQAGAQMIGTAFTYQGELQTGGVPADTPHDFEFRLFDAADGGVQVGPQVTVDAVSVRNGLFNVLLDFGPAQFAGDAQWLQIAVRAAGEGEFQTLSPRTPVTATPYAVAALHALDGAVTGASIVDGSIGGGHLAPGAIGAAQVDSSEVQLRVSGSCPAGQYLQGVGDDGAALCVGLAEGSIHGSHLAAGAIGAAQVNSAEVQRRVFDSCPEGQYMLAVGANGTVSCSNEAPRMAWSLQGNASTDASAHFLGTTDQRSLVLRTGNAPSLRIEPSSVLSGGLPITSNSIAGSHANSAANVRGAVIGGGGVPAEQADPDVIGGGPNHIAGHYGTIAGGSGNWAGPGPGDGANRPYSTVGGGDRNHAYGTVSTIAGGRSNLTSGNLSSVAGGRENTASGLGSAIGGGLGNLASAQAATVSGGEDSAASGRASAVVGGEVNTASGRASTVLAGEANCAGGAYSVAAGHRARVRPGTGSGLPGSGCAGVPVTGTASGDAGTFVWADSQEADFISTGSNQFLVRAGGGAAINSSDPAGNALRVGGTLRVDQLRSNTVAPGGARAVVVDSDGQLGINVDIAPRIAYGRVNSNCVLVHGSSLLAVTDHDNQAGVCRITLSGFQTNASVTVTPHSVPGGTPVAATASPVALNVIEVRIFNSSTGANIASGFYVQIIGTPL